MHEVLGQKQFDVVASSMVLHHADDKIKLFSQIFDLLKPNGVFICVDHMAGSGEKVDYLIGRERAKVKNDRGDELTSRQISDFIEEDMKRQAAEGNKCESINAYLSYLNGCGFSNVDCLLRDFWLAVFVATKPSSEV